MFKKRFISMLVLLMAVTGAWADDTYTVQFKANGNTKTVENVVLPHQFRCDYTFENGELDQIIKELHGLSGGFCLGDIHSSGNENVTCGTDGNDDYITISAPFEGTATVTGWYDLGDGDNMMTYSLEISIPGYVNPKVNVTGVSLSETTAEMTLGGETLTLTATVAPDNATNKTVTWTTSDAAVATVANGVVTAVAAGTATITATATNGTADTSDDKTATCTVTVCPAGYSVALKEGTDDAANWQGKAGEGEYQALPLTGLEAGTAVTVKYNGTKKVKSVKAVKKAKANPTLTLGAMSNGGDPFSGTSGSGAYSQTFAVGGQIAIIYKNTSNESVKVVTDALTAADISNEGMTATINVTIDDADKTQGVTYIYPAAIANDDGTINSDFTNQNGTVTAIYKGSGAWDGDALPSVSMDSQQAIVKFILKDKSNNLLNASSLNISATSNKLVKSIGYNTQSRHTGYTYDNGSDYADATSYLVDGNTSSKWCSNPEHKTDGIYFCEFRTASAVQVDGYTLTTGNDNETWEGRNPKDWVLKAKVNAGDAWTTIATVSNESTMEDKNCKAYDFSVDTPGKYQYFRIEISSTRGGDGTMQLCEMQLFENTYGTAYGDLTVTPASATSEIFVALRNENGDDTYTVSANVDGKKYAFSKSGVNFENGKYYEIRVKMAEQTASTVEWIFSEMSEHPDLYMGYTYKDVTLSGEGEGDLNFDNGSLYAMGDLTFTAPTGKHFKKIVINATGHANISGWTNDFDNGNFTSTWTGDASSVSFNGNANGVTSIVFTLE